MSKEQTIKKLVEEMDSKPYGPFTGELTTAITTAYDKGFDAGFSAGLKKAEEAVELGQSIARGFNSNCQSSVKGGKVLGCTCGKCF